MSKIAAIAGGLSAAGLLVFAAQTTDRFAQNDRDPAIVFVCVNGDIPVNVRTPTGERAATGLEEMFASCDDYVFSHRPTTQPIVVAAPDDFDR